MRDWKQWAVSENDSSREQMRGRVRGRDATKRWALEAWLCGYCVWLRSTCESMGHGIYALQDSEEVQQADKQ